MKKYAIIVAGGSGSRMGSEIPKQFIKVGTKPILMHTIERFFEYDSSISIILVLPKSQISVWQELLTEYNFQTRHKIVEGGETRYHSVLNGLNSIKSPEGIVAIHDGVRMFVKPTDIDSSFQSALKFGSGVLAVASKDSLRVVNGKTNKAVDRSAYQIIQTPQTFDLAKLKEAFNLPYQSTFTDDASVFEAAGNAINLVEGDYKNIKITTPEDLLVADAFLKSNT